MRIAILTTIAFVACLFIAGCVASNFMALGPTTYPPRPDTYPIDIYLPLDSPVIVMQALPNALDVSLAPSSPVIGRIDTNGAPAASWPSVFEDAKQKARMLGGDAIIIRHWGAPLVGFAYGQPMYAKSITMTVIRTHESPAFDPHLAAQPYNHDYSRPDSP